MPHHAKTPCFPGLLGALGLALTAGIQAPAAWGQATDLVCGGCVQGSDIANGTIGPNKLIPGSINATTIANGSIGPNKLIPGSINAATIANNAIRSNKILDGAVQSVDLADGAVTIAKIAAGAVGAAALTEDAVFGRVLVVRNDPLDQVGNCDELQGTLAAIADNDADNRYTILLEPGIYDCGASTVQMKPFVDIEGSGRGITTVRGNVDSNSLGVVTGANDCELRSLRVEHTGGVANAVSAISTGVTNALVTDVVAIADNSVGGATGIQVRGGAPVLSNIAASADNTGAPSGFSTNGVFVLAGTPTLVNVGASASGGFDSWGLQLFGAAAPTARNSTFVGGGTDAVRASGTVNLIASQLDGTVLLAGSGIANCVDAFDGNFALLDSNCSAIP